MSVLLVVSNNIGDGKTSFCTALACKARDEGKTSLAFKPFLSTDDLDNKHFINLLGQKEKSEFDIKSSNGDKGQLEDLEKYLIDQDKPNHLLIVEIDSNVSNSDVATIAEKVGAGVISVARYGPELKAEDISGFSKEFGDSFRGAIINGVTKYQNHTLNSKIIPSLSSLGIEPICMVPEDRLLLSVTTRDIVEHLDGQVYSGGEWLDTLVEKFVIGSFGLDSGENYLDVDARKAVLVRGDRPDVQMAVLQTPTVCMILTKGIDPIEYVKYEALEQEVPIIIVESDTISTMQRLDTIQDYSKFNHADKLDRFIQLLDDSIDLSALCGV